MSFSNIVSPHAAVWPSLVTPVNGTDALNQVNFEDYTWRIDQRFRYVMRAITPQYLYLSVFGGAYTHQGDGGTVWWDPDPGLGSVRQWGSVDGAGTYPQLQINLDEIPHQATVTEIRVAINGTGTYAGTPDYKVNASLMRKAGGNADSATALYSATDPNSHPNMTTLRDIVIDTGNTVLDRSTYSYYLLINGESGTNSVRGVRVYSVRVTLAQQTL